MNILGENTKSLYFLFYCMAYTIIFALINYKSIQYKYFFIYSYNYSICKNLRLSVQITVKQDNIRAFRSERVS